MTNYAPIALFVYERLSHTKQTVKALQNNDHARQSDLIVFSDGPKNSESEMKISEVRSFIGALDGFKSVRMIQRETNFGLSKSIITGVTEVVQKYGRVIVVEDDIITSKYFLRFMNESLGVYENEDRVISIGGYFYPVSNMPEGLNTFFLKGSDCWGWATWKRGWDLFEADGKKLLNLILKKKCKRELNFNNTYNYYKMLEDQILGINDSWAIRWYVSAFLNNKLTLYPCRPLVKNSGMDGSGTHCSSLDCFDVELNRNPLSTEKIKIQENLLVRKALESYFRKLKPSMFKKAKKIFRKTLIKAP